MEIFISILKLSAGVGLFLFAMYLLEESLKNLSGRNFKIFLQRITKNRFGAVSGGVIVTGILQSSSMVSIMVLAFIGAGVFTMKNAMAIILGANLGSTFNGWLVATLGFKVNIEVIAYPAVCIGGMLLIIFNKSKAVKNISYFLFGFGLLFIALSFMKTAMEEQASGFDFSKYAGMPLAVFLLIGFIITLLVQSSSVTMALTLSALHVGAINFSSAAAIGLGSETGTTIKIMLGAIGGNASKKRVAFGNFIFNVCLTIFTLIFLKLILKLITHILNISDPLIGLVTFSSLINVVSIIAFLPFLDLFAKFLEKFFKGTDASTAAFIGHTTIDEPLTALDLFKKETAYFIHNSMLFNLALFEIDTRSLQDHDDFKNVNLKRKYFSKAPEEKYEFLKKLEGELQVFYIKLRVKLKGSENAQINRLISSVRSSMYSVKCIKDVERNIFNLSRSSKDIKFNFFIQHKKETEILYNKLEGFINREKKASLEDLKIIFKEIDHNYTSSLNNFYNNIQNASIEDLDITTAINFNRELFTSNKAMLMAVKDFLLDEKQAEEFNEIPVYKT